MKYETLEISNKALVQRNPAPNILVTPRINKDYWLFKIRVSENQAIVGFPKFFTIGIGFQKEDDWNTNLPYTCEAEQIYNHIKHNKQDSQIPKSRCIKAIEIIQEAVKRYKKGGEEL